MCKMRGPHAITSFCHLSLVHVAVNCSQGTGWTAAIQPHYYERLEQKVESHLKHICEPQHHIMKVCRGHGGNFLRIVDFGTRWRSLVSFLLPDTFTLQGFLNKILREPQDRSWYGDGNPDAFTTVWTLVVQPLALSLCRQSPDGKTQADIWK
jgi:hypothetical protein